MDEEGLVVVDLASARRHAIHCAREIMAEDLRKGILNIDRRIDISDEAGNILMSVPFKDALAADRTKPAH